MPEVHIITGFLGAGKTTFINKLLREGGADGETLLVENEFGDVSVDGDRIGSGIRMLEITSGCICCSLQGNFEESLAALAAEYKPRQILIEPTGAANLRDTLAACERLCPRIGGQLGAVVTVVSGEGLAALLYAGGDFFRQQLQEARYIVVSGTQLLDVEELTECRELLAEVNPTAPARYEPWDKLDALQVLQEAAAEAQRPAAGENAPALPLESLSFFPRSRFSASDIDALASALADGTAGRIFRAKGFLHGETGMLRLDYALGRRAETAPTDYAGAPKFVVIGEKPDKQRLQALLRFQNNKYL